MIERWYSENNHCTVSTVQRESSLSEWKKNRFHDIYACAAGKSISLPFGQNLRIPVNVKSQLESHYSSSVHVCLSVFP